MSDIRIPRDHNYRVSSLRSLTEVNRWASEIDARIVEILNSLGESVRRVNSLTTTSTPGSVGAHAPQHFPQTGFDPLQTAAHSGGYALTALVGTSDSLLRADTRLKFPTALAEYTGNSTLTLTGTGSNQTLTCSLGRLTIDTQAHEFQSASWWNGFVNPPTTGIILTFNASTATVGTDLTSGIDTTLTITGSNAYVSKVWTGARFAWNITSFSGSITGGQVFGSRTFIGGTNPVATMAFSEVVGGDYVLTGPNQTGSGITTVTTAYGIRVTPWSGASMSNGSWTDVYGLHITFPRIGNTIRRAIHLEDNANNAGTEPANTEMIYVSALRRGNTLRTSISIEGHTANSVTEAVGIEMGGHTVGTGRYNIRTFGSTSGTPSISKGLEINQHSVGTERWSIDAYNKIEVTGSDFVCRTTTKGLVTKDAQGSPRYWRLYTSTSGTTNGDVVFSTDVNGILSVTRAGGAAGTVILNHQDVGTTQPLL